MSLSFYHDLHVKYIAGLASKLDSPSSYEGAVTEHLRMSGVYWSITALSILCPLDTVDRLMGLTTSSSTGERSSILEWIHACYDESSGGFGGNIGHDGHLLYTLSALQLLAVMDRLDDNDRLDKEAVVNFISSLQQEDGSFAGDEWGEVDTRFTYCALCCLSLLGVLPNTGSAAVQRRQRSNDVVNVEKAAQYVASCKNFDGGFGCVPGAESHAGQIFCCVAALSIAQRLDLIDADLLCWWLAERQCDGGGLNGRPEKQSDVCYSWWILSALSIMGRVDWINVDKLTMFILKCQDEEDGGIADRPEDMADVFHTFFGIAGLSLIGYLHTTDVPVDGNEGEKEEKSISYRKIDPVYALPTDVVKRMGLRGQIMRPEAGRDTKWGDDRLDIYSVHDPK